MLFMNQWLGKDRQGKPSFSSKLITETLLGSGLRYLPLISIFIRFGGEKKPHFNTDGSAKVMLACNVDANVWLYYSVNPSLNRMSRGTPERKGENRITELHPGKSMKSKARNCFEVSERLGGGKAGSLRLLRNPSQFHFCSRHFL